MHIAIVGITGVWNRGVQALVDTSIGEMRRRWPDARITVLTSDPEYDRIYLPADVSCMSDASKYFSKPGFVRPAIRTLSAARGIRSKKKGATAAALETLAEVDVVVALGGDIYSSDYGSGFLKRQVALLEAAQARKTPTVLLGQSIGPFSSDSDIATVNGVLRQAALITVRESLTQEYLQTKFGFGPERAVLTSDVAFLLEPSDRGRADAILRQLGLADKTYVAMAPSQGITTFSSVRDRSTHDAAWIEAITTVIEKTDHSVLLIPHVQAPRALNDDVQISFRLLDAMKFHPRIHAAFGPYVAGDYKAMIARARFVIGERMHACIAALSSCVPVITIGYSVKARGIVGDTLGPAAEQFKLITPVGTFIKTGQISEMIATVDSNIEDIRATMDVRVPIMRARAGDNFTRLGALLESVN